MNASQNVKSGSSFEQQLSSVQLSQRGRAAALNDARIAEMFVGAIVRICEKLARARGEAVLKSGAYYWE